ncbi:MAG: hypothetical protein ACRD1T_22775 [Acidimicrobiia bacterium]
MKPALRRIGYWTAAVLVLYLGEIFIAQQQLEVLDTAVGFATLGIWLTFLWVTKGPWRILQTGLLILLSGAAMLVAYMLSYIIFDDPLTRIDESALLIAGPVGAVLIVLGLIQRGVLSAWEAIRGRRGA